MKTKITLMLTFLFAAFSTALFAAEKNDSTKVYFTNAYDELKLMMEGKQQADFERAVFISENAYHNNKYSYSDFQKSIDFHLFFIESLANANNRSDTMNYIPKVKANGRFNIDEILISPEKKKQLYNNAINNWAIFTYMNDTTGVYPLYHPPFNYVSNDPFGMKNWSSSQVMNLLTSKKQQGNCFALTGFFKIMADRLSTGAYICTAPQHIYIQHQDHKGDYYNVELATAGHPGDGMLQTLTYTTSTAIESGISLRSYDDRQSIGLCMVNLAKAYEHKLNTKDDDFLLQCAETVLQNDSLNLNALLLKHQVLNERMLKHISQNKTTVLGKLIQDKTVSKTFYELEKHLARLNRLGYIQMPMDVQEMVLNGFQAKEGAAFVDRNPKPFTVEGIPEKYNHYVTLTGGLFQEVFEPKKFEEYGQFTLDTEAKTIAAIDTTKKNVFLIDPVAFAYDFGARIYDARIGRFTSIDPLAMKYPTLSPYAFVANSPLLFKEVDGNWFVKFDNENDPKQLVFVWEEGDNLATLEIQLGLPAGELSNNNKLKDLPMQPGTALSTELEVVEQIKNINKFLQRKDIDLTNCSNCALAANGIKQSNAWENEGDGADQVKEANDKIEAEFTNVSENDVSVGDIITFRLNKLLVADHTDVKSLAKYYGIKIDKESEEYKAFVNDAFNRAGIEHFGVALLKSRDGSSLQQYLEKSGHRPVTISTYPTSGSETFQPSPENTDKDSTPFYKKN